VWAVGQLIVEVPIWSIHAQENCLPLTKNLFSTQLE